MERRPSFLDQLIYAFQHDNRVVDIAGKTVNSFYHRNSSGNRRFKPNQRQERSLSRRKRMKSSSR